MGKLALWVWLGGWRRGRRRYNKRAPLGRGRQDARVPDAVLAGRRNHGSGVACVTGWFAGTLVAGKHKLKSAGAYDVLLVCFAP